MSRRLAASLVVLQLASTVLLALLIQRFSDSWGLATVLQFAPRWVWGVPLLALMVAVVTLRQWRVLGLLVVAGVVQLFAIMDLELPAWRRGGSGHRIRIMTANLGGPRSEVPVEALA